MKVKKVIAGLVALVTISSCSMISSFADTTYSSLPNGTYYYGDVNLDGKLKSNDLLMLKKHLLGILDTDISTLRTADVKQDGKIKSNDLLLLKKILLGLADEITFTISDSLVDITILDYDGFDTLSDINDAIDSNDFEALQGIFDNINAILSSVANHSTTLTDNQQETLSSIVNVLSGAYSNRVATIYLSELNMTSASMNEETGDNDEIASPEEVQSLRSAFNNYLVLNNLTEDTLEDNAITSNDETILLSTILEKIVLLEDSLVNEVTEEVNQAVDAITTNLPETTVTTVTAEDGSTVEVVELPIIEETVLKETADAILSVVQSKSVLTDEAIETLDTSALAKALSSTSTAVTENLTSVANLTNTSLVSINEDGTVTIDESVQKMLEDTAVTVSNMANTYTQLMVTEDIAEVKTGIKEMFTENNVSINTAQKDLLMNVVVDAQLTMAKNGADLTADQLAIILANYSSAE